MSDTISQTGFHAPDPAQLVNMFPGYEISRLIACGGMGAVYEAVQRSLDRAVAIKILPREFTDDAAFRDGFEAEAKAMAKLNHPNLIGVYDFGEVDGMLYIIMEYVPGHSLFQLAAGNPIDPCEAARLLAGVCRGLAHAHEIGIIHRDIKPANIMLDAQHQPKIGDFGLARPIEREIREGEVIYGTPGYTAPEVLLHPDSIDHRADIFSLGVMLHEMLTGKLPSDDPRPPSVVSGCDPRFDPLVRKATQQIPAARHATAAELAVELETLANAAGRRILQTAANAGSRPTILPITAPVPRRSSSGPVIAALMVAILVVGGLLVLMKKPGTTPAPNTEIRQDTSHPPGNAGAIAISTPPDPRPVESPPPLPTESPDDHPAPEPVAHVEVNLPDGNTDDHPLSESVGTLDTLTEMQPPTDAPVAGTPNTGEVEEFFARARTIMSERTASAINEYHTAIKANADKFERDFRRINRRVDTRFRDYADNRLQRLVDDIADANNRIPRSISEELSRVPDSASIHESALSEQKEIDAKLLAALTEQAAVYIVGLERQVERFVEANYPGGTDAVRTEIQRTRENPHHFGRLMMDPYPLEPEQPPREERRRRWDRRGF